MRQPPPAPGRTCLTSARIDGQIRWVIVAVGVSATEDTMPLPRLE
ncbi:hypothetical protein [Pseudonocardia spinosispora]|nr:hypothetical protein [Pseudonocardia spinosispora]